MNKKMQTGQSKPVMHLDLRESLSWFAEEMERVMRENDHKHGIATDNLFNNMVREVFELNREMHYANPKYMNCVPQLFAEAIIKEAVDVANYAMMIANNYRKALKEGDEH